MASHHLLAASLLTVLMVPIAIVRHSNADTGIKPELLDTAVFEDLDAPLSLLQKAATLHRSASRSQNSASKTAVSPQAAKGIEAAAAAEAASELAARRKAAAEAAKGIDMAAAGAEFVAMALFVIIGCGSAMGMANKDGSAWVLQVALTFGLAITVLAYSIGHVSGGQINCAVTFALVLNGSLSWGQGVLNLTFQLLGSVTGALILSAMYPPEKDLTGNLGSNGVGNGWSIANALIGEVVGTFVLCFTVLNTAVDAATVANRQLACLAIGLSVFLAHSVLIPIDGCSINPTRSFGPALISERRNNGKTDGKSTFTEMWIFWVGPLVGAALAVGVYKVLCLG